MKRRTSSRQAIRDKLKRIDFGRTGLVWSYGIFMCLLWLANKDLFLIFDFQPYFPYLFDRFFFKENLNILIFQFMVALIFYLIDFFMTLNKNIINSYVRYTIFSIFVIFSAYFFHGFFWFFIVFETDLLILNKTNIYESGLIAGSLMIFVASAVAFFSAFSFWGGIKSVALLSLSKIIYRRF